MARIEYNLPTGDDCPINTCESKIVVSAKAEDIAEIFHKNEKEFSLQV